MQNDKSQELCYNRLLLHNCEHLVNFLPWNLEQEDGKLSNYYHSFELVGFKPVWEMLNISFKVLHQVLKYKSGLTSFVSV